MKGSLTERVRRPRLTSLMAFLRSCHSFHSYDLSMLLSTGWSSVCAPQSCMMMGLAGWELSPGSICEEGEKTKQNTKEPQS